MEFQQENNKSYLKLAQIYNSFQAEYPESCVMKYLLKKKGDINYKIPFNSSLRSSKPNFIGCSLLHIAAMKNDPEITGILLSHGARIAIQNQEGQTALHSALVNRMNSTRDCIKKLVNVILSTHLSLVFAGNPCNNDGLSHLHIACMYNRMDVVEFFVCCGASVDTIVNSDAKRFAGYSPLHFAADGMALSVINGLLKYGAKLNTKNAQGLMAIHIFIEEKIRMFELYSANNEKISSEMMSAIDDTTNLLLDSNDVDHMGFSHFHIACTQRDTCVAEYFLEQDIDIDQQVKMDSPIRPGYTALHFALHCNLDTVKMLLKNKANCMIKDANGVTSMELIWKKCNRNDLQMLIAENWKNAIFSDKQTRLTDFIRATYNTKALSTYLENLTEIMTRIIEVPECWSRRTLLHFAVMLPNCRDTIELCMKYRLGLLVDVQDSEGSTPIHLAFRMHKLDIIQILVQYSESFENYSDRDNLSYLHIACALRDCDLVKKVCRDNNAKKPYNGRSSFGCITPGSTALHVAVDSGDAEIVNILLQHGFDLSAKDAKGQSPLHRLFRLSHPSKTVCQIFLSNEALTDCMLEELGMTKLHLAVFCNEFNVQKYISPSNIEATINCKDPSSAFFPFHGYTPLHIAIKKAAKDEIIESLLNHGADLLIKNHQGDTPLYSALSSNPNRKTIEELMKRMQYNKDLRQQMEEISGITMLHIACYAMNKIAVSLLLVGKLDVNARVRLDCPVWSACTPLHLLMKNFDSKRGDDNICQILHMLLTSGADVSAMDANNETPILLALRNFSIQSLGKVMSPLVKNLQVFNVNPVNENGMSHFHAACLVNNIDAVKSFLENGVDVNQPVDYFAKNFPGERPLHLAVDHRMETISNLEWKKQTILLLLNYGADLKAEDSLGHTAFHKAVILNDSIDILEMLFRHGAAIDAENIFKKKPVELLLQSEMVSVVKIKFFEKCGYRLNGSNPLSNEGYLSMLISKNYHPRYSGIQMGTKVGMNSATQVIRQCFNAMVNAIGSFLPDHEGRHLIHNIVTTNVPNCEIFNYNDLIKKFQAAGLDIDLQDHKGRTALHLAVQFGNLTAVKYLLENGADVNVLDKMNRPALNYAIDYHYNEKFCPLRVCHKKIVECLVSHITKLRDFNLNVSDYNILEKERAASKDIYRVLPYPLPYRIGPLISHVYSLVDDQPKLFLEDFLSESGKGLISYPFMSETRRERIDTFFSNYVDDLKDVCALQYRKAVKRTTLVKLGMDCLWRISGRLVPIDCIEEIFQYLINSDLDNLIKATTV